MIRFFLFFFSLAFDFRGVDEGGVGFQFVLFGFAILTGVYIIIRTRGPRGESRWFRIFRNLLVIHAISTLVVALIQDIEFARYVRIVSPYVLLVLGYLVGIRAIYQIGFQKTIGLMMAASIVATLFTVIYGFASAGVSINEIRYQILSPMIFVLVPLLAYRVFMEKKQVVVATSMLLGILTLILISATRSWLIAYIGVVLLAIAISKVRSFVSLIKGGIRGAVVGSALMAVLLPVFMEIVPDVMDRLSERVFIAEQVGFDVTAATRIAEMDYQINAWLADVPSFLIGRGLGASYGFAGTFMVQLTELLGSADTEIEWWFAGHNFWVYSLFTQGLLFGWVVPFLILYGIYVSWRRSMSGRYITPVQAQLIQSRSKLCLLVLASMILATIGGNPLGSRMLSQYIGVIISVTIAVTSSKGLLNASVPSAVTESKKA